MKHLLLKLYAAAVLAVVGHELSHFAVAKLFRFSKIYLCIGIKGFWGVEFKNCFLSPFALSSYVEIENHNQGRRGTIQMILFYFAGIFFNLSLAIMAWLIQSESIYVTNLLLALASLLPVKAFKSDCFELLQYLKRNKTK